MLVHWLGFSGPRYLSAITGDSDDSRSWIDVPAVQRDEELVARGGTTEVVCDSLYPTPVRFYFFAQKLDN